MTKPVGYQTNYWVGPEGEAGVFYNYIMAADGLYIRAKNEHLVVTVNLADVEVRGLAPITGEVTLLHGKIPMHLLNLALSMLIVNADIEKYLAIIWDGEYHLKEPMQEASSGHVTYETLPNTVLDIHSHTGSMPARFSSIDNFDEKGFMLYAVVADLRNLFPTVELRLGVYGYFLPLAKEEVFA
jgi:PRTRC genetic system protein A